MANEFRRLGAAIGACVLTFLASPALGTEFGYCQFESPRGRDVVAFTDVFPAARYDSNLERKSAFRTAMQAQGFKVGTIFCFQNATMAESQASRSEGIAKEKKFGARVLDVNWRE
jgi:hypothetical protein